MLAEQNRKLEEQLKSMHLNYDAYSPLHMDPEDLRDVARCIRSILDVKGLVRHEELDAFGMTPQLLAMIGITFVISSLVWRLSCLTLQ